MRQLRQTTLLALLFFLLTGFGTDPNGKANALYVNASKLMQSAKKESGSYTNSLDLYRSAREKIDRIITDYAAANIAVALISEQTKIAGLALGEFEQLEGHLRPLAEAEQDPLACAQLVAEEIEHNYVKAKALSTIAGRHVEFDQKEKAVRLLTHVDLLIANLGTHGISLLSQILLMSEIAVYYAVAGEIEKATQKFARAFEMGSTLISDKEMPVALAGIARKYLEANKTKEASQALTMALKSAEIDDDMWQLIMIEIAGMYLEISQIKKALQLLSEAHEITDAIKDTSSEYKFFKIVSLSGIAGMYIKTGQIEDAHQLLSESLEKLNTIDDILLRTLFYVNIAGKYNEAGETEKAAHLLSQAIVTANAIENNAWGKSVSLFKIAEMYAVTGQTEKVDQLLSQADEIANTIHADPPHMQIIFAWILLQEDIFTVFLDIQNGVGYEIETKVLEEHISRGSAVFKARILSDIAGLYADIEEMTKALETANTIDGAYRKAMALSKIAGNYIESGKQLSENEKAILHDIVQATNQGKLPWE